MADLEGCITSTCNDQICHDDKVRKCKHLLKGAKQLVKDIEIYIQELESLVSMQGRSKNYKLWALKTRDILSSAACNLSEIVDSNHYDHQVFFD